MEGKHVISCNCRPYRRKLPTEKMITSEGAKKAGVKVILALGGRPEHRTVYVVDTDEVDKLYEFLSPALSWAKCDIAPVRELDF